MYGRKDFEEEYEKVRKRYIEEAQAFFKELANIKGIKVYPSMANFALVELLDGTTSADFVARFLIKYGIYTRTGSDKIGLNGEFVRIAGRKKEENDYILEAMKNEFG